jgi:hypothetical protein
LNTVVERVRALEPEQHGFRLQQDPEPLVYRTADLARERDNVAGGWAPREIKVFGERIPRTGRGLSPVVVMRLRL